ncbi:MAG: pro-sigmaK processing inhibitor BofA family protein [Oscillospiraceae bacterium]|nr:pro-sigmaK processing inhibitor BofA family protein [Oscillospiraceae bacterium]
MDLLIFICGLFMLAAVAWGFSKSRHPYITAAKSAVSGLSSLLLINLVSSATGCYIAINGCTVFIATVLSLPGVFALLVMKIIFNY